VWDDNLSETENIYRLRNAGIERRVIADHAWGNGVEASARSKVQRIYLKECAARGEEPRATGLAHDTNTYRDAYAYSFRYTLAQRLAEARDAVDSVHGALTLHGRSERVDEAFYARYPEYRPSDKPTTTTPCAACAKAKSGHCRKHPGLTRADYARYDRMTNSPSARAGEASGRDAANGVVIERVARAQRVTGDRGREIES